jgi:ABC-type glycerol-3-phosphate transport system substrate-binding protein
MRNIARSIPLGSAILAASLLLAGCSSPIVGNWKGPGSAGETALRVKSDHTYTATITPKDGAKKGSSGDWEKEGDGKFRFIQHTGEWPRVVNAELVNNKSLDLVGEGVTTHLKKD